MVNDDENPIPSYSPTQYYGAGAVSVLVSSCRTWDLVFIGYGRFPLLNQKLVESPQFLWIVAITNNRAFDGCSLLAMGALMLHFWLKETSEGRRRIVAIGLVMLLTAVVLNQLGQALIPVKRASPTLMLDNIYRVSELLHIPTKDASRDSFPAITV